MRPGTRRIGFIVSLLTIAFAVRLVAGVWWQTRLPEGTRFVFGDSESYWVLAQAVVRGGPYEYGQGMHVFRAPGYPVLLAGLFAVVGDDPPVLWARGLGAVFGTLAVGGVMCLAWQLFDGRTAMIAGALAALYPGAIGMSTFALSEAPFCPLMLAQLICWSAALGVPSQAKSTLLAAVAGLAAGGAMLVRPSWLLFTPFAVVVICTLAKNRRRQLGIGLTMLVVLTLTMVPWWIRNYRVTGRFVVTTLQVGASLYDGLNPDATGASNMEFVSRFRQEQKRADAAATGPLVGTFESRLDGRMRQAALSWAQDHPGDVACLMMRKLIHIWSPWPRAEEMQNWAMRVTVLLGYTPLLVLGLWGAIKYWRSGWSYRLCVLPAGYFTCLHVVFVSSIRYRQPAMLAMIVLAAGVLSTLIWRDAYGKEPVG